MQNYQASSNTQSRARLLVKRVKTRLSVKKIWYTHIPRAVKFSSRLCTKSRSVSRSLIPLPPFFSLQELSPAPLFSKCPVLSYIKKTCQDISQLHWEEKESRRDQDSSSYSHTRPPKILWHIEHTSQDLARFWCRTW